MIVFELILLTFLIGCSIAVSITKSLYSTVVIFMSYSLVMSLIWIILRSPDLAITEAAVGAGVTTILFFITLKNIDNMKDGNKDENDDE